MSKIDMWKMEQRLLCPEDRACSRCKGSDGRQRLLIKNGDIICDVCYTQMEKPPLYRDITAIYVSFGVPAPVGFTKIKTWP
jgi:hypothetical protein